MKKHRKTVLAAIMLILVVASAVFAARVHTVSLDAEKCCKNHREIHSDASTAG